MPLLGSSPRASGCGLAFVDVGFSLRFGGFARLHAYDSSRSSQNGRFRAFGFRWLRVCEGIIGVDE